MLRSISRRLRIGRCGLVLLLLASAQDLATADEWVIVHTGNLIRKAGEPAEASQTMVVHNGVFDRIVTGYQTAAELGLDVSESAVIDLRSYFVLPGLIDLHVHLTTPVQTDEPVGTVPRGAADLALVGAENARKTVLAGVTTAVDLGTGWRDHEEAIYALREAITAGDLPGPRLLVVGSPISATGSSRTRQFAPALAGVLVPQGVCDGADDCRRAVREQIKRGADLINFYDSGSLNDTYLVPRTFTDEEMHAIVETAHSLGRRVIADGHTAEGVNAALRAGADIVDTVPWPDEETWRLLHRTGATFVPHLQAFRIVFAQLPATGKIGASPIEQRFQDVRSRPLSAKRALREKVPMALGSDTGIVEHGGNAGDLEDFVAIGMTPAESLAAATTVAAEALGLQDHIGVIAAGMSADFVAVDDDPQRDVRTLRRVRAVMVRGRLQQ